MKREKKKHAEPPQGVAIRKGGLTLPGATRAVHAAKITNTRVIRRGPLEGALIRQISEPLNPRARDHF